VQKAIAKAKKMAKAAVAAAKKKAKAAQAIAKKVVETKKKAKAALAPKPKPLTPCDQAFQKQTASCKKNKKTSLACITKARTVLTKCKTATAKAKITVNKAKAAAKPVQKAKVAQAKAAAVAKAVKKFKDVKSPGKKTHPVGIFENDFLFYITNADGTVSWIKFPTEDCSKTAKHGVQPAQFPRAAKKKWALNPEQSKVACKAAAYDGQTNVAFYKNCGCNGKKNKKGNGASCQKWGYKFNWCYVSEKCRFGNTARSGEVPASKVLVGCKTKPAPPTAA